MPRYAIYFVPDRSSGLARFGASVLGTDPCTGAAVPFADHPVFLDPAAHRWSEEPRKYGFHATLKAPFELREGESEATLAAFARTFAAGRGSVTIPRLEVGALGHFLALVPAAPSAALDELAAACVRGFEPFRAPLAPADRERRLRASLSPRQIAYLDRWGYPYVFEEFRFHMTLTGPLPEEQRERLRGVLTELYSAFDAPVRIDALSLCRQAARDEPFTLIERFPLRSQA